MLGWLKTTWRLNEGSVAVQNLLQQHGCPPQSAKALAHRWVAEIVQQKHALFAGKFGSRPHKISVAAIALVQGLLAGGMIEKLAMEALSSLLLEVARNGRLYSFSSMDLALLEAADREFLERLGASSAKAA